MATIKKQLTQTFKQPNIAESYGPYISVSAAHVALSEDQLNVIGMTVGIQTGNTIEEYWYQGGTEQANLVKKQTASVEVDTTPTQNSSNAVSSGGVYNALQGKANTSDIPTISTNITTDATSDTKTASPKSVKTYVDNGLTGKQNTIGASNTINSDFVDDTNGTNKFVTSTEKGLIGTAIQGVKKGTETLTPVDGVVTVPSDIESAQATSVSSSQSATATIDSNHVLQLEIPRGADAVNPFKGWHNAITTGTPGTDLVVTDEDGNLVEAYPTPVIGDYAYIKTWYIDTTQSPQVETPITKIYECTTAGTWSDSGRTADTSNVQTFASGEEVNETPIDDTHLVNPADGALPTANDVMQLKAKLQGVTMEETKQTYTLQAKSVDSDGSLYASSTSDQKHVVIALGTAKKVRFLGQTISSQSSHNYSYAFWNAASYVDSSTVVYVSYYDQRTGSVSEPKEYIVDIPEGATYIAITVSAVTENNFYCYLQSGDSAVTQEQLQQQLSKTQDLIDLSKYVSVKVAEYALTTNGEIKPLPATLSKDKKYLVKLHFNGLSQTDLSNIYVIQLRKGSGMTVAEVDYANVVNDQFYAIPSNDATGFRVYCRTGFKFSSTKKVSAEIYLCDADGNPVPEYVANIIDNLESQSATNALSANQGHVLNEKFAKTESSIYDINMTKPYNLINVIGMTWEEGKRISPLSGNKTSDSQYSISDYIEIDPAKGNLYFGFSMSEMFYNEETGTHYVNTQRPLHNEYYCFFDKDKNVIAAADYDRNYSKVIPQNAKYVRVTAIDIVRDYARLIYSDTNIGVRSRQVDFRRTLTSPFNFSPTGYENFNMVAFGDSLTHGKINNGVTLESWCDYTNDELRCNIINCGFGGTKMTGDNSIFNFIHLCETIVSDEADKWDDYDTAVLTNTDFAEHLTALKSVDWNTIDAITIWYGANDYVSNVPVGSGYNETETNYDGACAKGIKMLQTKYPHLQVLLISPIWGIRDSKDVDTEANTAGLTMPDYVNSLSNVSSRLHCPIVDLYRTSQFNSVNKLMYSSDATHIRTTIGVKRFAHLIAEQIKLYLSPKYI